MEKMTIINGKSSNEGSTLELYLTDCARETNDASWVEANGQAGFHLSLSTAEMDTCRLLNLKPEQFAASKRKTVAQDAFK
jgi:hypothetical protein